MQDTRPQTDASKVTQTFVDLLNELLRKDPQACEELLAARATISDGTKFIVSTTRGKTTLGVLGFINTALNELGLQRIAVCHDGDSDQVSQFAVNQNSRAPVTPVLKVA